MKKKFLPTRPEGAIRGSDPKLSGEIRPQKPCLPEYRPFLFNC